MDDDERVDAPATIGELRRRLKELGDPWTVPDWHSDDDPLPEPPRGGLPGEPGHVESIRRVDTVADLEECLGEFEPTNPLLIGRWRELGMTGAAGTRLGDAVIAATGDVAPTAMDGDAPEWGMG